MIVAENVEKRFGDIEVLKRVNLKVEPGEVVTILGASGSGKSTLIRCINGLEALSGGRITVDGHDVSTKAGLAAARRASATVFQLFNLVRKTGTQQRVIFQNRDHFGHISFGIKQADDVGVAPQAGFTRQRFKHRGVMRVLEGDRDRTGLHQRITHLFGIRAGCVQF